MTHQDFHVSYTFHNLYDIEFGLNPTLTPFVHLEELVSLLKHESWAEATEYSRKVETDPVNVFDVNVSVLEQLFFNFSGGFLRNEFLVKEPHSACFFSPKH